MFYSTFTAATLLVSIAGNANAAVAAERSLDPVAYKTMHPHPHYMNQNQRPADTVLAEIHARHVRRSDGLGRRQSVDESSDIGLQEVESWYWGGGEFTIRMEMDLRVPHRRNRVTDRFIDADSTEESKRNPVVNLTGIAQEGERYLSQERFGDSVSAVDCTDDAIKFTFRDQEAFEKAEESWNWVNEGDRTVTIVLNANTCGNEERKPYIAKHVSFADQAVTVEATESVWRDSFTHAKLLMNTQGLIPDTSALQRRQFGFIDDLVDTVTDLGRISDQRAVDLSSDFSGLVLFSQAINNTEFVASIECSECRTRGGLELNIEVDIFNGLTGSIEVRPSNLGADVVFDVRSSSFRDMVLKKSC
jgi:hypothetical protein